MKSRSSIVLCDGCALDPGDILRMEVSGAVATHFDSLAGGGRLRMSCSHGDPVVLALAGRLDAASVLGAARKLVQVLAGAPPPRAMVVDLAQLEWMTAAGVVMLHGAADHAAARHTAVRIAVGSNPVVARLLGDPRVAAVLDTYPDRAAALSACADRDTFVEWAERLWHS